MTKTGPYMSTQEARKVHHLESKTPAMLSANSRAWTSKFSPSSIFYATETPNFNLHVQFPYKQRICWTLHFHLIFLQPSNEESTSSTSSYTTFVIPKNLGHIAWYLTSCLMKRIILDFEWDPTARKLRPGYKKKTAPPFYGQLSTNHPLRTLFPYTMFKYVPYKTQSYFLRWLRVRYRSLTIRSMWPYLNFRLSDEAA